MAWHNASSTALARHVQRQLGLIEPERFLQGRTSPKVPESQGLSKNSKLRQSPRRKLPMHQKGAG